MYCSLPKSVASLVHYLSGNAEVRTGRRQLRQLGDVSRTGAVHTLGLYTCTEVQDRMVFPIDPHDAHPIARACPSRRGRMCLTTCGPVRAPKNAYGLSLTQK